MDTSRNMKYLYSLSLVKLIGLYQILDPKNFRIYGFNAYHVGTVLSCVYISAICVPSPLGLYHWSNDLNAFVFYFGLVGNFVLTVFKMINIVYYSEDIRKCVEIARFGFISSYQHYNMKIFKKWQKWLTRVSFVYVMTVSSLIVVWLISPWVLNKTMVKIKNVDGSYSEYRMNIYNMYLMVTPQMYNEHYMLFYAIEAILLVSFIYFQIVFDIILIIICSALTCQLEIICDAVQTLGYKRCQIGNDNDMEKNVMRSKATHKKANDLINIITDHQSVIKKLNDFYNIFRVMILPQILMVSNTHIQIWFIASMNFMVSGDETGNSILSIKLFSALPMFTFQLFMTCYLFGTINEKKDSIIFALYSSNWTEMDVETKKQIMFAMKMNNTNNSKMKFTLTKIVNLEMFTSMMRMCYSIFSMLVNYNRNKTE
ncbi:Olfactory receptor, insect [Cinara cedri]|uniref:Odorant receptor n=1 Tax=Cinara cedri TaxID=506608 RepID=A0A5E4M8R9_9HEMI|nr:Olfactory receptor, insect [Cinara cedri]